MKGSEVDKLVEVLGAIGTSPNEMDRNGETANAVDGLFELARAVETCGTWLKYLGGGENSDQRGAVEYLASAVGNPDKDQSLAECVERGLGDIADAIREGLEGVAVALAKAPR